MSKTNLRSLLTNPNKIEKCKIVYSVPEKISVTYFKLNAYNQEINHPLHKFWFMLENVKIIKKSEHTFTIVFANDSNRFIEYIKRMESDICLYLKEQYDVQTFITSTHTDSIYAPTTMEIFYAGCTIYNHDKKLIKYNDLFVDASICIFFEMNNQKFFPV